MPRKQTKLVTTLAIVGVAFLLFVVRPAFFGPLKFSVVRVTSLPFRFIAIPLREFKKILFYHRIFDDYMRLRTEVETLRNRLVGLEEVLRENTRLSGLLEFKHKLVFSSIAASVIDRAPSRWTATMMVDKGRHDGVTVGMPVVNALGVVGKIAELSAHASKVILITDPSFSVAALVQRSRDVGLVSGTLQGMCRMRYLSPDATVAIGDTIITSKISSSFPEGLIVGEVMSVRSDTNSLATECLIQPAVSLSQIEEVLIILKQEP